MSGRVVTDGDQEDGGTPAPGPLADLRVLDLATVFAGPGCARHLADFGADVIKIERPDGGDTSRNVGWRDPTDNQTLFWKFANRNKRTVALDLKSDAGRQALLQLVETSSALVENFRPGKLEALGLGPDVLWQHNPKLVITRVTGFGQTGPYRNRPGFATVAEAMAGFAGLNGEAGRPPLLPPIALTDELTAVVAAFATMVALHSGVGQVVDVSLVESLLQMMGPLVSAYGLLGYLMPRMGSRLPYTVPRSCYECADGRWVAVSTSADSVARRVMVLIGVGDDERFATFEGRSEHADELDGMMAAWMAQRSAADAVAIFEEAEAAAAIVYDMADIFADAHLQSRQAVVTVGGLPQQGVVAKLSATPGSVRWSGRTLGADTEDVLAQLPPQ
ncbi:MAG: CaiB/BaiF CoA transferase family protein [Acidimicrobiales bacterium]